MSSSDPPPPYTPYINNGCENNDGQTGRTSHMLTSIDPLPAFSSVKDDDLRPLPVHWIRKLDPRTGYPYFVDTSQTPRSTWQHPYDDVTFLNTLSASERSRIQELNEEYLNSSLTPPPFPKTPPAHKDEDYNSPSTVLKLGRKLKDAITNTTHEERKIARQERMRMNQEVYNQRQQILAESFQPVRAGEPQITGIDNEGKDIWIGQPAVHSYYDIGMVLGSNPRAERMKFSRYGHRFHDGNDPLIDSHDRFHRTGFYSHDDQPRGAYQRPNENGYSGGIPLSLGLAGGLMFGGLLF